MSKEFQDELLLKLPTMPSCDVLEWYKSTHSIYNAEAIIYRNAYVQDPLTGHKEKMCECRCSACKEVFYLPRVEFNGCRSAYAPAPFGFQLINGEQVWSGDNVLCPECAAEAEVFHVGAIGRKTELSAGFFMTVERIEETPVFLLWRTSKSVSKSADTEIEVNPWEAYAFSKKRCYKYVGYTSSYNQYTGYQYSPLEEWKALRRCEDTLKNSGLDFYCINDSIFEGTCLQNAKINLFIKQSKRGKCYLISYLRSYLLHNQLENLVNEGLSPFINQLTEENSYGINYGNPAKIIRKGLDFKQKKPAKMLGLNKEEYFYFKSQKWTPTELDLYKKAREKGNAPGAAEFKLFLDNLTIHDFKEIIEHSEPTVRICRYLLKQQKKYPENHISWYYLSDYWKMAEDLGEAFDSMRDKYPQNIKVFHDRYVEKINERTENDFAKKEKKERAAFRKLKKEFEDFNFAADGFCIFIAPEPKSLRYEGKILSHCVGRYVKEHAKGERCIFFLRKSEYPQVPFYTVTLDTQNLKITMNLGHFNCIATPEVEAFSEKWLEYIREVRSKKDERKHKYNRNAECA
ncbi:MAG: PcfJ domain-containing protein [Clostridia bacterium]|nr:PcfJ domain-containing protein [Clostridia bacterium]